MRRSRSWCWYRYISNMFVLNDLTLFPWWAILIIELKLDMFIPFAFAYYAITWPPLNGNLPSIFMWYFCCFFQLTVWPSRGFNHFFSKNSLHKILKVKSFHVFFTFYFSNLFFKVSSLLNLFWFFTGQKHVLFFSGYHVSKMNLLMTENVLHHYLESKKLFFYLLLLYHSF